VGTEQSELIAIGNPSKAFAASQPRHPAPATTPQHGSTEVTTVLAVC